MCIGRHVTFLASRIFKLQKLLQRFIFYPYHLKTRPQQQQQQPCVRDVCACGHYAPDVHIRKLFRILGRNNSYQRRGAKVFSAVARRRVNESGVGRPRHARRPPRAPLLQSRRKLLNAADLSAICRDDVESM